MATRPDQPLIVIVGPTASGKTSLAIELAQKINGEIICADSRTVYIGMDIGTAKPTKKEQNLIPHWGLDLVEPSDQFNVSDFKKYADNKVHDIMTRGKIPIMVGGSGLYVDSVILDYKFIPNKSSIGRGRLETMDLVQLHEYCSKHNIKLPENENNKRYVIRAIELNGIVTSRKHKPDASILVVGITTDKIILKSRIRDRTEQIFIDGVVDEATKLGNKYGWSNGAMTGNVYRTIYQLVNKEITLDEAKEMVALLDWRLVKKQLTWFKRNNFINWCQLDESEQFILQWLAKHSAA